jgi:hypothetical protein
MRIRIVTLGLLLVMGLATPAIARKSVNMEGTVAGGGTFQGTYDIFRFLARQGQIFAEGSLQGTLTQPGGATRQVQPTAVQLPVTLGQSSCRILEVRLGAVTIDLLGLQVTLSLVTLTVEGQQAPGNLLGNLLCTIASLLDPASQIAARSPAIADTLNQILAML